MLNYGLYDTKEQIWFGDDDGPNLYSDYALAKTAARVLDVMLGSPWGQTVARAFIPDFLRKRDEVPVRMSVEEALEVIESGALRMMEEDFFTASEVSVYLNGKWISLPDLSLPDV